MSHWLVSSKFFALFLTIVTLCRAQTINIRGAVIDFTGVGISGATVKLEKTGVSATTEADGSFILAGSLVKTPVKYRLSAAASPVRLQNGKLVISLLDRTLVSVDVYDIGGRRIFYSSKMYDPGTHIIPSTEQSAGINLYKVGIGKEVYPFKSLRFDTFFEESGANVTGSDQLVFQAKVSAVLADIIDATKEGFVDYCDSIRTTDTSGIIIRMLSNAGNVVDADKNVYQSVLIGNQVWMVGNFRTTKYNDGTPIFHVVPESAIGHMDLANYCFYGYSTDAVYTKKWGALYNWFTVRLGNFAPVGWHVPTETEWDTLQMYLVNNGYNWDGTAKENKIAKALAAKTDWIEAQNLGEIGNDPGKNNASGFSALPGGYRSDCHFNEQNQNGYWWTSSVVNSRGRLRTLQYNGAPLFGTTLYELNGYSVRLIKN